MGKWVRVVSLSYEPLRQSHDFRESVQRHRHPTRLSDVLEEDERSKASIAEPVNEWISVKANPKPKPVCVSISLRRDAQRVGTDTKIGCG